VRRIVLCQHFDVVHRPMRGILDNAGDGACSGRLSQRGAGHQQQ
jgi:hypothetical protein